MGCYRKMAEKKRKESLEFVFSIFPILKDRQKQMAGTLSGGEQQMLAIGRALMSCPELLMLDEPSLGLAPIIVQKLFKIINEIREREISILLVEQNIKAALQLADRGYVLENGRIVLEGDSKSLLNNEHVKRAYLGL
jgi:branched-chain amino acid transport system ATP-binding protein